MFNIVELREASVHAGRWLLHLKEVDSTNTLALGNRELLEKKGLVIVADRQSSGRGRRGRRWCSSVKGNLYASFILHDFENPPYLLPYITLISGLALFETIRELGVEEAAIKWPNDILIGDKKVAGILVETKSLQSGVHAMVVGIGVNLKGERHIYPEGLRHRLTTLEEVLKGEAVDRFEFLDALSISFDKVVSDYGDYGPSVIVKRWEHASNSLGRRILVEERGEAIEGVFLGLSERGHLLLKSGEGEVIEIVSGDVTFLD